MYNDAVRLLLSGYNKMFKMDKFGLDPSFKIADHRFYDLYVKRLGYCFMHPSAEKGNRFYGLRYSLKDLIWGLFYADPLESELPPDPVGPEKPKEQLKFTKEQRGEIDAYLANNFNYMKDFYEIMVSKGTNGIVFFNAKEAGAKSTANVGRSGATTKGGHRKDTTTANKQKPSQRRTKISKNKSPTPNSPSNSSEEEESEEDTDMVNMTRYRSETIILKMLNRDSAKLLCQLQLLLLLLLPYLYPLLLLLLLFLIIRL
jgi:hypothetical protein